LSRKSLKSGLLTLLLVLVLIVAVRVFDAGRYELLEGRPELADGDSLVLSGQRIRLLGLDAPELAQTCRMGNSERPCGRMARDALREIVGGRIIRCEAEDEDRYGRLLARCYLGDDDVGEMMVRAGWALSSGDYGRAEAQARKAEAGLWAMQFMEPKKWRDLHNREDDTGGWSSFW
jgi:endonuclease YncB( thermonuclease family)